MCSREWLFKGIGLYLYNKLQLMELSIGPERDDKMLTHMNLIVHVKKLQLMEHSLPVSYCYSALPCPIHVSHLSLACLHSGCSRCLFSLSFSFCLILLSVSVSMLLFCTPFVGWLRWLFSSLSVHRGIAVVYYYSALYLVPPYGALPPSCV